MTEKSAVTPRARSVQMKKKAPLDLAIAPPTPAPLVWMTGMPDPRSDPRRMMTYPDTKVFKARRPRERRAGAAAR